MSTADAIFKGYWLVTNRCNLDCGYCVLEDAPDQLRRELSLEEKKAFTTHLYERLRFRRLTLSGGEVLMIGKKPPADFIGLLRHLRQFRTADQSENLELEVYTNAVLLDDTVADEMAGVVDRVAITIDSARDELLTLIGRNTMRHRKYFDRAASTVGWLDSPRNRSEAAQRRRGPQPHHASRRGLAHPRHDRGWRRAPDGVEVLPVHVLRRPTARRRERHLCRCIQARCRQDRA